MEQNMNNWIYIKSDCIIDAYAVASVLNDVINSEFFLVRRTRFAKLFKNHPHISMSDFYDNSEGSKIITINPTNVEDFNELTHLISEKLGIDNHEQKTIYTPDMPDVLDFSSVDIFFMLSEEPQEPLNLNFVDIAVSAFKSRQISIISAGTIAIPCIRGCRDYRGLITWEYLPLIAKQNKSALIITNDFDYIILCKAIGLEYILLKNDNGVMYANNEVLNHPNELINLINQKIS